MHGHVTSSKKHSLGIASLQMHADGKLKALFGKCSGLLFPNSTMFILES